ncbi:MAG: GtrA family protein [Verrucomicrobiota bacterium]|nr:GtrA family protein [Verrucomicrobiota bacterium]
MTRALVCHSAARPGMGRFFTFTLVGSVGTAIQYAVLGLGVTLDVAQPVACSAVGYALGSVANYLLNYRLTFQCKAPHAQAATKYFTILAVGWLINLCLMFLFVVRIGWSHWISQVLTTVLGLVWNYTGSHRWAFHSSRTTDACLQGSINDYPRRMRYALATDRTSDAPDVIQIGSCQAGERII